ncbi:hypothetical protein M2282_004693 [Variovorax boronicumulans]|uniref:hypothetical protein n=1 Tax=Variovorax boronicumulans TaxID=436515 RepID=UPI002473BEBD|nr:hypothetical protein [Variovorax boronicumulans]MDH6169525.1 hypothetical protein [Variovorax boronicumulans]
MIAKSAPANTMAAAMAMRNIAEFRYDERVRLSHELIAGLPYYIEVSDGRKYSGRVDEDGHLPRIFTEFADTYKIYWGDEALARMEEEQA